MRRGHRDGQGEYYFNGQPCRLKDIHKLFMDTGMGRTSYSIMAQGQDRPDPFFEAGGSARGF